MKKSGFTLIELSIVLVIIGLLIGGIIAGKELIRSSELNSVVAEYQGYRIALVNFRAKYDAIPGDMANATTFWGAEPAANCPGDQTTPSLGTATCNGNGDNYITYSGAAGKGGEVHRFWQHLANAGMISGQYTGTHSAGGCNGDGSCNMTLGVNTPASKLRGAAWTDASQAWLSASTPYYFRGGIRPGPVLRPTIGLCQHPRPHPGRSRRHRPQDR